MKRITLYTIASSLVAFGLLTLFMSGSVIFDLFNIRAQQGNYVLFIVWANFFRGVLFLTAAIGFVKKKISSFVPLIVSLIILLVAFAGLMVHINGGGVYETKTVAAMIFRITVNAAFVPVVYSSLRKLQTSGA